MIFKHWYEGGPLFMTLIYLLWLAVIVLIGIFFMKKGNKNLSGLKRLNEGILFTGSLAFLLGILGQVIGIFEALKALETMRNHVSASMIAGGLKVSFLAPFYGFVLFLISGIVWFVFRNRLKKGEV
ncbi:MotA/TolQ/ExbB proton channel family protein [Marinilabilia sp.]